MPDSRRICDYPITVHPDATQLAELVAERIIALSAAAIVRRDGFHLALSGGSTPRRLYQALADDTRQTRIDWSKVHLYFGDERAVPPTHPDSNYRMARESLIERIAIPEQNVHPMLARPERIEQDADDYAMLLRTLPGGERNWPEFDVILLGLGPDGHTCSLFPGTPILNETARLVAPVHVERLDSWRISLTYPVLNRARCLMFLVAGSDKAEIMRRICHGHDASEPFPVERIQTQGQLEWHLDQSAAASLKL